MPSSMTATEAMGMKDPLMGAVVAVPSLCKANPIY